MRVCAQRRVCVCERVRGLRDTNTRAHTTQVSFVDCLGSEAYLFFLALSKQQNASCLVQADFADGLGVTSLLFFSFLFFSFLSFFLFPEKRSVSLSYRWVSRKGLGVAGSAFFASFRCVDGQARVVAGGGLQ